MSDASSLAPALHALEAEVMDAVWDREEASVRAVMDALNERAPKPRAYTTYMTILRRLHAKGLLDRRREGKTDHYRPVHTRAEYRLQLGLGAAGSPSEPPDSIHLAPERPGADLHNGRAPGAAVLVRQPGPFIRGKRS
jgi:hypothetical protein